MVLGKKIKNQVKTALEFPTATHALVTPPSTGFGHGHPGLFFQGQFLAQPTLLLKSLRKASRSPVVAFLVVGLYDHSHKTKISLNRL